MVGLLGSGTMAWAIARGLGEPVLASDADPARAGALADATGGEAVSNAELAARADLVVLCHKPYQLEEIARELDPGAGDGAIVSILGATALERVRAAHPARRVARVMPNTPVELRAGVVCLAEESDDADRVEALFARMATVVRLPERLLDVATGVMGVAPAYYALIAEAQVDAAVRRGLDPGRAGALVAGAMAGSATLLAHRDMDTLAVRRAVTSPGGSTARGVAALEARGLRTAFDDAMTAVLSA